MAHGLIVYYSRTSHTRRLAEAIAHATGWDLEPVIDMRPRRGALGYVRSALEAATARLTPLGPTRRDPRDYDVVVIGTPVWSASLSSPIRTYLEQHRAELGTVAFFLTGGGRGVQRVFAQMAAVAGVDPVATLALDEPELHAGPIARHVQQLLADIETALRPPVAPEPQPTGAM
jgi:flavodoxin